MTDVDPITGILLPYVNFLIFFGLAVLFFRKPIAKMVAGKRQAFEALVRESQRLRNEARERYTAVKAKYDGLDSELARLQTDMVAQAQLEADQALESARRLGEHIQNEAKRIADSEIQRARDELKLEVLQEAMKVAQKEISERLSGGEHGAIVQRRIADLESIAVEN